MPYIKNRTDNNIYYKEFGEGRPIVLIHGWPLSADSFDCQAIALADAGFRVIAYDRKGFGRSDQPWTGYDYDALSDDLADVMKHTHARKDVSLVGFSMGGGEIARYMSRHKGEGVVSSVLISSVVPYMLKTNNNPHGTPEKKFQEIEDGLKEDRAKFFRETFFPQFFGVGIIKKPVSKAFLDATTVTAMQAGLKPTLDCAKAFSHTDFRPDLESFKTPTLIIHGTGDKTVPIDAAGRAAAKGIKHAKLIEYDGEPHGLNVTSCKHLNKDLIQFLKKFNI